MTDGSSGIRGGGDPGSSDAPYLHRLIDEAGLGLVRLDRRLVVKAANGAAHRLLERRPGTLIGQSAMEAFLDHRVEETARGATEGGSATTELGVGRDRVLTVRARPAAEGGAWIGLEDVSELRRLRRIRAEFIDNLSHELRTPLSTIRLLTETLTADLERIEVPDRVRERVAKVDVETGHLVQMVTELLDLSRMEQAATNNLNLGQLAIAPVLRAAIERLRTFADRHGVALRLELPEPDGLPPIVGDDERLSQLLVNLLHNALKFSPAGGEVVVGAVRDGEDIVVSITDQGPGIPRAEQDRVFERFYKVDKARVRGVGGTGLGLSIARHIAEAHGGRLWVESEEGRGSTFSLALPVDDRPEPPESMDV
ncbi:MAG: two-component system, OmpR family, phosphate regulon sensor histidine kinase PhoR [Chloroflexota bacterium]|nr:two-component system, OmpR family, phosphate regulon sensor histidine kinase PhoR [Chloroflexota bacterium]